MGTSRANTGQSSTTLAQPLIYISYIVSGKWELMTKGEGLCVCVGGGGAVCVGGGGGLCVTDNEGLSLGLHRRTQRSFGF